MNHREFLNRRVYRHFMRGDLSGAAHLGMSSTARYIRRYERERGGETGAAAVARSGGVCYNSHRCAAMGSETPATKQRHNGTIKQFPNPVNGSMRPALCFARLRGWVSL